jgi:hypothetical protein
MTKINYGGSIVAVPVSPLKLLQFHVMELENKLKDYVPEGELNFYENILRNKFLKLKLNQKII